MYSLLVDESPWIAVFFMLLSITSFATRHYLISIIASVILLALMWFYRHYPPDRIIYNNEIIAPANGVIDYIGETPTHYIISIFLNLHNVHTQVSPCNGYFSKTIIDENGRFALANEYSKSRDNEKRIHSIGDIEVTQIAGKFVRRISSVEPGQYLQAGDYLGIIKFGSRVDVKLKKNNFVLLKSLGDNVNLYDTLGYYSHP